MWCADVEEAVDSDSFSGAGPNCKFAIGLLQFGRRWSNETCLDWLEIVQRIRPKAIKSSSNQNQSERIGSVSIGLYVFLASSP